MRTGTFATLGACAALALASSASAAIGFHQTPYALNGGSGSSPQHVVLSDLDGQNGPDIVVANPAKASIVVLLNDGDGTFGPATIYSTHDPDNGKSCPTPTGLQVGQLNAATDQSPDVIVSCGNAVARLFGDGTGALGGLDLDGIPIGGGFVLGEMNGGGGPELLYGGNAGGPYFILCMATFQAQDVSHVGCAQHTVTFAFHKIRREMATTNLSDDPSDVARDEVIVPSFETAAEIAVFGYSPNLSATDPWTHSTRATHGAATIRSLDPADLDDDGDQDLIVGASDGTASNFSVFRWGTSGWPPGYVPQVVSSTQFLTDTVVADFDKDGKPDVAALSGLGSLAVHPGKGDGTFAARQNFMISTTSVAVGAAGDLDGDGWADLVYVDAAADSVYVLLNAGPPPRVTGIPSNAKVRGNGTIVLGSAENPPTEHTVQTLSRKGTVIARGTTTVADGDTRQVIATLTRAGRRLLGKLPLNVRLRILASAPAPDGRTTTVVRTVGLRRA